MSAKEAVVESELGEEVGGRVMRESNVDTGKFPERHNYIEGLCRNSEDVWNQLGHSREKI